MVTCYTAFVIDLASRRVQILGATPFPEALFMSATAWNIAVSLTLQLTAISTPGAAKSAGDIATL